MSARDRFEIARRLAQALRCLGCGQPSAVALVLLPPDEGAAMTIAAFCPACWVLRDDLDGFFEEGVREAA